MLGLQNRPYSLFSKFELGGWFCCKDLLGPNSAGLALELSRQLGELTNRADSERELAFADHLRHFDSFESG